MKLPAIAVTLILLLLPGYHSVNRPEPSAIPQTTPAQNAELLKLEAQLKQLDQEAGSVKVKVTGDKESSGNVKITVEREVAKTTTTTTTTDGGNANTSGGRRRGRRSGTEKTVKEKETVLDIDLSKLNISDEYVNAKIAAVLTSQARCGSLPGVKLSQVGVSVDYEVVEDYIYDPGAYKITVFKGFVYDRASIPRFCWAIIDKDSLGNVAPLLHDLLYRHGGVLPANQISPFRKFSRKDTDNLFLELMTKCGVGPVTRRLAYEAVRTFAGFAWKGD